MKIRFFLLAMLCLMISSCSDDRRIRQTSFQNWAEENGKIKVLNTTAMIDDLVKQVGKDHVDTLTLIQGELDPHSYQLVKGDDEKLAVAQLIFYNGLELEHGPSLHRYLADNPNAIGLGDLLYKEEPEAIIFIQNQKDPHIWMDISLWQKMVPFIVKALSQYDPAHAAEYQANAKELQEKMTQTHQETITKMHEVEPARRYLITSHDAFNYFARAYLSEPGERESGIWQERFAAPEGLSPESQLSTADIKMIIDKLKKHGIQVIFSESNVSRHSLKKIIQAAGEEGVEVRIACCALYGDAMGAPGSDGETYLKMMEYNARTLATHMNAGSKKVH